MAITVISYPNNEINLSFATNDTLFSQERVKNMFVEVSGTTVDTYIELVYNGVTTTYNIVDECRYTPLEIVFLNKEGEQQTLTFFKEKIHDIKTTEETFESDRGQPSDGNHQFVRFNVQGKESFKAHSGYVDEQMNDTFKELLLSSKIWQLVDKEFTPINIKTSSLTFKTRQRERLISYEIQFELSYNTINNV